MRLLSNATSIGHFLNIDLGFSKSFCYWDFIYLYIAKFWYIPLAASRLWVVTFCAVFVDTLIFDFCVVWKFVFHDKHISVFDHIRLSVYKFCFLEQPENKNPETPHETTKQSPKISLVCKC